MSSRKVDCPFIFSFFSIDIFFPNTDVCFVKNKIVICGGKNAVGFCCYLLSLAQCRKVTLTIILVVTKTRKCDPFQKCRFFIAWSETLGVKKNVYTDSYPSPLTFTVLHMFSNVQHPNQLTLTVLNMFSKVIQELDEVKWPLIL